MLNLIGKYNKTNNTTCEGASAKPADVRAGHVLGHVLTITQGRKTDLGQLDNQLGIINL